MVSLKRRSRVAVLRDDGRTLPIEVRIVRRPRREAIDVAVAHAEDCGNRIQASCISRSVAPCARCARDVFRCYGLPALGRLASDRQQRFQLVGDRVRPAGRFSPSPPAVRHRADDARRWLHGSSGSSGSRSVRETKVAINSRSPRESVCGPCNRTSTSSLIGLAVSGRKAIRRGCRAVHQEE